MGSLGKAIGLAIITLVSIQLVSPTSGEYKRACNRKWEKSVSIQLVSPTSGEEVERQWKNASEEVSIQLVSPTSGEQREEEEDLSREEVFPFNWFPQRVGTFTPSSFALACSSRFPFNWFPQRVGTPTRHRVGGKVLEIVRFHLIGFPSEWGHGRRESVITKFQSGFHLIGFPSEWGHWLALMKRRIHSNVSI